MTSDAQDLPESVGRGNLAEETAAAIGLPAPEQQQETIRQLQPRASWQQPIKDDGTHIDEQDIVDVLVMGSGFCEGRFRIQEFFSATVLPTVKEQANWLKKNTVSAGALGISEMAKEDFWIMMPRG